jgi:hypothetical protein
MESQSRGIERSVANGLGMLVQHTHDVILGEVIDLRRKDIPNFGVPYLLGKVRFWAVLSWHNAHDQTSSP